MIRKFHCCWAVLAISIMLTVTGADAETIRAPRTGWSKMLFAQPNASAAPQLLIGLNAEVIQQYEDSFLAYVPASSIDTATARGLAAGIDHVVRDDYDKIHLPGGIIDTRLGTSASLPGRQLSPPPRPGERGLWLIQFVGPLIQSWQDSVRQLDVTLVQYVPYNAFIAAATEDQIRIVQQLSYVQFTDVYHRFLKSDSVPRVAGQRFDVLVILADAPGVEFALQEVAALSDREIAHWRAGSYVQAVAHLGAADADLVAEHPMVVAVSFASLLGLSDERVSMSLTRNVDGAGVPTNPRTYTRWLSEICEFCDQLATDGFYAGAADTGLDGGIGGTHHADLPDPGPPQSRIRYGTNFYNHESLADEDTGVFGLQTQYLKDARGHGTMVAATIAGAAPSGAGTDAGGFYWGTGVAPSAGLFITKIRPNCGFDVTTNPCPDPVVNPPNANWYNDIFTYAGDAANASPRVFFQNHSRNQYRIQGNPDVNGNCLPAMDGKYTTVAANFDIAVRDADGALSGLVRPITLTVSSGNRSQQPQTVGCLVLRGLTLAPGTAKNVIAVGGAENARGASEKWDCMGAQSNSFSNIMANSKHGTTIPGRFKPDLMAPSSSVVSLKTSGWQNTPWPQPGPEWFCPPNPTPNEGGSSSPPSINTYLAGTGTSFAAPVAAGAALLAARVYAERIAPNCRRHIHVTLAQQVPRS